MSQSREPSIHRLRSRLATAPAGAGWIWKTLPAVLLLLLALLGYLQYRWIGEVAVAERERLQTSLDRSARDFTDYFDRIVTDLFVTLQYDPRSRERRAGPRSRRRGARETEQNAEALVLERYDRWLRHTEHPQLVSDLYLLTTHDDPGGSTRLASRKLVDQEFLDAALPAELASIATKLADDPRRSGVRLSPTLGEPPSVIASVVMLGDREGFRMRRVPAISIALLNREYLHQTLLPEMVARYFADSDSDETDFDLRIVSSRDGTQIYPGVNDRPQHPWNKPDSVVDFFSPRRFNMGPPAPIIAPSGGEWRLEIQHRAGSLEAVVARTRRRNLLLSLGILSLLAAALSMLLTSTRRAQQLAQQQVDFVASITHELNTPLAALRSAGQNLADGVVVDPQKIGQYGSLILKEGHRLSNLVGQALDYAGMQGGSRQPYDQSRVDLGFVLRQSIDNVDWLRQESGAAIDLEVANDLLQVSGDRTALVRMADNLLTNAIKYGVAPGSAGARVEISVRNRGDRAVLTVRDHGQGIAQDEKPRVFEPFFRGSAARQGTISGSGLGLALVRHIVERHGGLISIDSSSDGTTVEVELPTAPE